MYVCPKTYGVAATMDTKIKARMLKRTTEFGLQLVLPKVVDILGTVKDMTTPLEHLEGIVEKGLSIDRLDMARW